VRSSLRAALRVALASPVVVGSLVFIVKALRFFSFEPSVLGKYQPFRWVIVGHVAGGMLALATGPFQLSTRFRARYTRVHRVMGRLYVGGTSFGAVCALVLASTTARSIGGAYVPSLHVLATVWLVSSLMALRTALTRRFVAHREWATRSYIATVAFVAQSLSFEIPFVVRLGPFSEVAATVIWLSWTVPLFLYETTRTAQPPQRPRAPEPSSQQRSADGSTSTAA